MKWKIVSADIIIQTIQIMQLKEKWKYKPFRSTLASCISSHNILISVITYFQPQHANLPNCSRTFFSFYLPTWTSDFVSVNSVLTYQKDLGIGTSSNGGFLSLLELKCALNALTVKIKFQSRLVVGVGVGVSPSPPILFLWLIFSSKNLQIFA